MPKINQEASNKNSSAKTRPAQSKEDLWEFEQFVNKSGYSKSGRRQPGLLVVVLLVVIVVLAGLIFYSSQVGTRPQELRYKAIYLDTGQVYYAKVVKTDELNVYLDDVYYVQPQEQTLPPTEEGGEPQAITVPTFVSRSSEAHKPQGWLEINREKVVAMEELAPDSPVLAEIEKLKK